MATNEKDENKKKEKGLLVGLAAALGTVAVGLGLSTALLSDNPSNMATPSEINSLQDVGGLTVVDTTVDFLKTFDPIGSIEPYQAPYAGNYRLNVWGAQGGSVNGGYGGFSTGVVELVKDEWIYANVGKTTQDGYGGYNGGGNGKSIYSANTIGNYGGGGLTCITTVNQTLPNLSGNRDAILIVAGGGGAGKTGEEEISRPGGSGGGIQGNNGGANSSGSQGRGGSQLSGGAYVSSGYGTSGAGTFGQGGAAGQHAYGGGGGFYGGSGGVRNSVDGAGGGGSGYINNDKLTDKAMYGYNLAVTSNEAGTLTYSVNVYSDDAEFGVAKAGDGYATAQYISYKYLADLKINGVSIPDFNPEVLEYEVILNSAADVVEIEATKGATYQTVTSLTDFALDDESNLKQIKVTADDGSYVVYEITIIRDLGYAYLKDLKVNGTSVPDFEPKTTEYTICVPNTVLDVTLEAVKGASYQTITYPTDLTLSGAVSTKEIEVEAYDGTKQKYTLNIEHIDPRLKSITVTNGTLTQAFSPDRYTYNVIADVDYDWVEVDSTPLASFTTVRGNGRYTIPVGTTIIELETTDYANHHAIYTLNVIRAGSPYKYLDDLIIDGKSLPDFEPEKLYYEIPVDIEKQNFTVDFVKGRISQQIYLPDDLTLKTGENRKEITVISEDGKNTTTYVVNFIKPHSSKLKSLSFGTFSFNKDFSSTEYEYYLEVDPDVLSVPSTYQAYDDQAVVKVSGNGYVKNSSTITVTVTEPNCETTVYRIIVLKETLEPKTTNFGFKGEIEEYEAPYTGTYRLEVWGAQGGSPNGGYGGYSTGEIDLVKGQIIYVNVGGTTTNGVGGYNGGGRGASIYSSTGNYGGGGLTAITTVSQPISQLSNNRDAILIVAGGGGGGKTSEEQRSWYGGSGGGIRGNDGSSNSSASQGKGGTQTSGGGSLRSSYSTSGAGSFGQGGTAGQHAEGGGGGYYGGSGGVRAHVDGAGGGGSGYIGNSLLKNKVMYGYNVTESSDISTKTVSTTAYSNNAISYYAKGGDGAATITFIGQKSPDNFLETLYTDIGTLSPEFYTEDTEYTIDLDDETSIKVFAIAKDREKATIKGTGEYTLTQKETPITVTVTAENGDEKEYHILVRRKGSNESRANNIIINGLIEEYCNLDERYGVLTPDFDPDYDSEDGNYTLFVPYQIEDLTFVVEKMHPYATVEGDGKVTLTGEETTVTITITAEDEIHTTTYTYVITRDYSTDADLTMINVTNPDIDIGFETNKTDYRFSIPHSYRDGEGNLVEYTSIGLVVTLDDDQATYEILGNDEGDLQVGDNKIRVVVTARNGRDKKIYTLNVYRENLTNVLLSNITVKNGVDANIEYPLNPEFNELIRKYKVSVPNDVTSVTIDATSVSVENEEVVIFGKDTYNNLHVGDNVIPITVFAPDGSEETYIVEVTRAKNDNPYLENIQVFDENGEEFDISPSFDKDTTQYMCLYDSNHETVNILVTPAVSTTQVKFIDGNSVKKGSNIKRIMAIAEDGTSKMYTINVYKTDLDDNNYLKEIEIEFPDGYRMVPEFSEETKERREFNVILPRYYFYKNISIKGITESEKASVKGNGTYIYGNNVNTVNDDSSYTDYPDPKEITLTVIAENKAEREYVLKIYQEINSGAYLDGLEFSRGVTLPSPGFDKDVLNYTIDVENDIKEIEITAIPKFIGTTVTGDGHHTLSTGENTFEIVTLSEDKTETLTYTVVINRAKSNNANIASLELKEGDLSPDFDKNTTQYYATVPYDVRRPNFIVELEDETATYEILDSYLTVGLNTVTIKVTAENGDTKDYFIDITRQDESDESNYLTLLKVDKGTLTPEFNKTTLFYEVEVPLSVSEITVTAIKEDPLATVEGDGLHSLEIGKNYITVKVTSTDNFTRTYKICVTRSKGDEARLAKLDIDNTIMTPSFNKDIYDYTLTTTSKELKFNSIVPIDEEATYEIIGNRFETVGCYDVIIKVTAADKKTKKEYHIAVDRKANNNNNLASLIVYGYEISPEFDKLTTKYTLEVENDIQTVMVGATAEEATSTIEGIGEVELETGLNIVNVVVTSELGNKKTYTIEITRKLNDNNLIKSLTINNGTLNEKFKSDENDYTVNIPYGESEVEMSVVLDDTSATYRVVGNENLHVGENTVTIIVTSQSGVDNPYILTVTREAINSAYLEMIKIDGYEVSPTFNKYINDYTVTVNYEVENLNVVNRAEDKDESLINILIKPEDENAQVTVTGYENLEVGKNTLTVTVRSSLDNLEEVYTVEIERQPEDNSYLEYLYTSVGTISPSFDKEKLEYTLNVANNVSELEIFAKAATSSARVEGTGVKQLAIGENKFEVVVTTETGVERTYKLTVNRAKRTENYLLSLDVTTGSITHTLNETFDKETKAYTLNVSNTINSISLDGRISDGATVTGLKEYSISKAETEITITVTSEAGVPNEYTLTVIKTLDSRNFLTDITPSVGAFESEFMYDEDTYELYLEAYVSELYFTVETESIYATVTGHENKTVPSGDSTRIITVTAQNGDEKEYTINIHKDVIDNSYLSSLLVTGYDLVPEFEYEHKDRLEYTVNVPYNKDSLVAAEVVAIPDDTRATVEKTPSLILSTKNENKFIVLVTAKDGFTTSQYVIKVVRAKNNDSTLLDLKPTVGTFGESYAPSVTTYDWLIPKSVRYVTKEMIEYTLSDENATIEFSEDIDMKAEGDKVITVTVTSEDEVEHTTYTLNLSYDESANTLLKELNLSKSLIEPEFDPETYEYTVYTYVDATSLEVEGIPDAETSIVSGNGTVNLLGVATTHVITVTAQSGATADYTLNIYKTMQTDTELRDIYLGNIEDLYYDEGQCVLNPKITEGLYEYQISVPYTYDTLNIQAIRKNGQQTVKYLVDGEEMADNTNYPLPLTPIDVIIEVYDGLGGNPTSIYTVTISRDKSSNVGKKVYLNNVEIEPNGDNEYIGTITIKEVKENGNPTVKVVTDSGYAWVQIDTLTEVLHEQSKEITIDTTSVPNGLITIPILIKAENDSTDDDFVYIDVINNLVSIEVETSPKLAYKLDDELDITGGVITVTREVGDPEDINITSAMISGFDTSEVTDSKEVTITYTENGISKETTYNISVRDVVTGINIENEPDKLEYVLGEDILTDGGTYTLIYKSGADDLVPKEITSLMVSGYNKNEIGEQEITVTYTDEDGTFTDTYNVTVISNIFNITYNLDGGTNNIDNPSTYTFGIGTQLKEATKEGYTFDGWYLDLEDENSKIEAISTTDKYAKELYAKWTINTYTMTFDTDGGSTVESITQEYGTAVTRPDDPTKEHYTFDGWYKDEEFTEEYTFTTMPAENITVYAKFTGNTYNITYVLNDGTNDNDNSTTYTYGVGTELKEATKTGYTFSGWYTTSTFEEGTAVESITITDYGDKTLYAKFTVNTYNITYYDGEDELILTPSEYTYGIGATLPKPEKTGYTFNSWYEEDTFETKVLSISATDIGDKTVYAEFTVNTYDITYVLNGGTNDSDNPATYTYGVGTKLKEASKTGYTFGGWYTSSTFEEGTSVESITTTDYGNKIIYASFTANEYTITYYDGTEELNITPNAYTYGVGLTLPDYEKTGYTFGGWYEEDTFETKVTSISATDIGNKVFYAKTIANEYTITYYYSEEVLTLTPNKYTYGIAAILPEYELEGYTFEGWYTTPTFTSGTNISEISEDTIGNIIVYAKESPDFGTVNGRITTKNVSGEYKAKISIYNHGDRTAPIQEISTENDGTYTVQILDVDSDKNYLGNKFDMVITKAGYLSYTVENIQIGKGEIVNIGRYDLIPGDVASDGEIELDDLVYINEYYGTVITDANREIMGRYDLNEDGIVDSTDRGFIVENIDAKAETVDWVTITSPAPAMFSVNKMSKPLNSVQNITNDNVKKETKEENEEETKESDEANKTDEEAQEEIVQNVENIQGNDKNLESNVGSYDLGETLKIE